MRAFFISVRRSSRRRQRQHFVKTGLAVRDLERSRNPQRPEPLLHRHLAQAGPVGIASDKPVYRPSKSPGFGEAPAGGVGGARDQNLEDFGSAKDPERRDRF